MLRKKFESREEWTDSDIEKQVKVVTKKYKSDLSSLRAKFEEEIFSMASDMDREYYHYLSDAIEEFNEQCNTIIRMNDMLERNISGHDWGR